MWLILLIFGLFIFFLYGFIRSAKGLMSIGKEEKPIYWNGPAMTDEQRSVHMEWVKDHIRKFPTGTFASNYPEIQRAVLNDMKAEELSKIYEEADKQYRAGLISKEQYEEVVEAISKELDITHLQK